MKKIKADQLGRKVTIHTNNTIRTIVVDENIRPGQVKFLEEVGIFIYEDEPKPLCQDEEICVPKKKVKKSEEKSDFEEL